MRKSVAKVGVAAGSLAISAGFAFLVWQRAQVPQMASSDCGACHTSELTSWRSSRHAMSFTNAVFLESYRQSQHPWCLTCHAPEGLEEATSGVSCITCHVKEGSLKAAQQPSWIAKLAHPIEADPMLRDSAWCGRCHQFNFPTEESLARSSTRLEHLQFTEMPSQDTLEEWRSSSAYSNGITCQNCHMQSGSHAFPGAHDTQWMRNTIHVEMNAKAGWLETTVSAIDVGHAIPSGDPFRRMRLRVCADVDCQRPLGSRPLHRWLTQADDGWQLVEDTRIPSPTQGQRSQVILHLDLPPTGPADAYWTLTYHYADPRHERALPKEETSYVVASGMVRLHASD